MCMKLLQFFQTKRSRHSLKQSLEQISTVHGWYKQLLSRDVYSLPPLTRLMPRLYVEEPAISFSYHWMAGRVDASSSHWEYDLGMCLKSEGLNGVQKHHRQGEQCKRREKIVYELLVYRLLDLHFTEVLHVE